MLLLKLAALWLPSSRGKSCAHAVCDAAAHLLCVCVCVCVFPVPLPSSSVASSNQDIMRAKRGCISSPRGRRILRVEAVWTEEEKIILCFSICATVPGHFCPVSHWSRLVCFHWHVEETFSVCTSASVRPYPHPASRHLAPFLPPYRNLAHPGSSCSGASSARAPETRPRPCSHEEALTIVCVCVHTSARVCVTFPLAQDSLFIRPE